MKKLLPILLLLSACGFSPVYGSHDGHDAVANELNQVMIENIPDRQGQMMKNDLMDRMYGQGRPASPQYRLHVVITSTTEDLGIQADATSTRSLLNLTANFTLQDSYGKTVLTGLGHSITSYNLLLNQYGSLVASEDAMQRAIHEASEQIVNRLNIFFAEGPLKGDDPKPVDPDMDKSKRIDAFQKTE